MPSWIASALAAWLGAVLGSFANVLIHRLPEDESILWPPSRCPRCRASISWRDNIPLLSWLLLRGRCRRCRGAISPLYPAVELVVALLGWGLWRRWQAHPYWAGASLLAACDLVAVAAIDWKHFIIPDELSLGLLVLGLCVAPLNPIFAQPSWWKPFLFSVRGAAIGFALCYGAAAVGSALFGKEAMGGGDVKLLAAIGAWSGGLGAFDCLLVGSLLGSIYGLSLLAAGRLRRSDPIPFGPFLVAAALLNLFLILPLGFPLVPIAS
ncbi:MAG: prepilin peptidase [Elusimicrobia bacterium]|nr:prepilin peptidase [Elusimicrobiota bacterium]MDE2236832.1 prepilin peptidase [Elusimicrobiota bacterium]MDE2424741.1 prepilin peptidase [Elusimicrobiota bacterium]